MLHGDPGLGRPASRRRPRGTALRHRRGAPCPRGVPRSGRLGAARLRRVRQHGAPAGCPSPRGDRGQALQDRRQARRLRLRVVRRRPGGLGPGAGPGVPGRREQAGGRGADALPLRRSARVAVSPVRGPRAPRRGGHLPRGAARRSALGRRTRGLRPVRQRGVAKVFGMRRDCREARGREAGGLGGPASGGLDGQPHEGQSGGACGHRPRRARLARRRGPRGALPPRTRAGGGRKAEEAAMRQAEEASLEGWGLHAARQGR
mmetsp:Transcript_127370/g.396451  ORF Transcript_127370/g.396451 Transcript_127370/m.396451 type:complete len:261 (-) Transcript_127370:349-1131(-)